MILRRLWLATLVFFLGACGPSPKPSSSTHPPDTNAAATPSTPQDPSGNPLTAPVDYLGGLGKAKHSAQRTVDLANVSRAVQMFYASEDRYPKDLKELVTEGYLPQAPVAPPGMRLIYNPSSGEVRIIRAQP
jgi:hypothetical protein